MKRLETRLENRIKVLYVDDCDDNLQVFNLTFRKEFEIFVAESGSEGLDILEKNKEINVVISDYCMPYMNGLEFIEKAREINNNIPYYILSASYEIDEFKNAIETKLIVSYFRKPVNKNLIIKELNYFYQYLEIED